MKTTALESVLSWALVNAYTPEQRAQVAEAASELSALRERLEALDGIVRAGTRTDYSPPVRRHPIDLQQRFERFHRDNPDVLVAVIDLARQLKRAGRSKCGMKAIFEVLRWRDLVPGAPQIAAQLNNDYTAPYARAAMAAAPDLTGFFDLRESAHDSDLAAIRQLDLFDRA